MPGPGAHLLYALSGGAALSRVAGHGRFGPHHCAVYAANAFLGPDLGSFAEWLCSFLPSASAVGGLAMAAAHHPFYYPLLLGLPLAWAYAWLSRRMLRAGVLDSPAGVSYGMECFLDSAFILLPSLDLFVPFRLLLPRTSRGPAEPFSV
jgi:hypothetical protein